MSKVLKRFVRCAISIRSVHGLTWERIFLCTIINMPDAKQWSRVLSAAYRARILQCHPPEPEPDDPTNLDRNHVKFEVLSVHESRLVCVAHVWLSYESRENPRHDWWTKAYSESLKIAEFSVPRLFVENFHSCCMLGFWVKDTYKIHTGDLQIVEAQYPHATQWAFMSSDQRQPQKFVACFDIQPHIDLCYHNYARIKELYNEMCKYMSIFRAYLDPVLLPLYDYIGLDIDNAPPLTESYYNQVRAISMDIWMEMSGIAWDEYWRREGTAFETFDRIRVSAAEILLHDGCVVDTQLSMVPWLQTVRNVMTTLTDRERQTVIRSIYAQPHLENLVFDAEGHIWNTIVRLHDLAYQLDGHTIVFQSNVPRHSLLAMALTKFLLQKPGTSQFDDGSNKRRRMT